MNQNIEDIYRIAATATVMNPGQMVTNGQNLTTDDQTVYARIKLKKEIYDFLKAEKLGIDVVVNKLLENFILAYKAFWESYNKTMVLRPGFEPGSRNRESRMIGRATPPELGLNDSRFLDLYFFCCRRNLSF